MKFKKKLKPGEKNEDFYHVFEAFEALSTFSNVCQINIAAENGPIGCGVSSLGIQNAIGFFAVKWLLNIF